MTDPVLLVEDDDRVRALTLHRPAALNAFNEELYDATAEALLAAAEDPTVAVVLLTGTGRAFCAGTDLREMHRMTTDPSFVRGRHGFPGLLDALVAFPKPLVVAVNGLAVGIGATILGFADVALIADDARLRCPFTSLGVAPEAASSYLLPRLIGRQEAAWMLLSAEWVDAAEAHRMGLVREICARDELLATARTRAAALARQPLASLQAVKETLVAPLRDGIAAARERENAAFAALLGGPANREALAAFAEGRPPDFVAVDAGRPPR